MPPQELPRRSWSHSLAGDGSNRCRVATLFVLTVLLSSLLPSLYPITVAAQNNTSDLTPITAIPIAEIPIAEIQGVGVASSFAEQHVTTWGLVTGVTRDGFYLQDPIGDGDTATSDGLFVYTWNTPTVAIGQCVRVAGEVVEFYAKTELNRVEAITPAAACGAEAVTPVPYPLVRPDEDPTQTLESLEGMVVRLDAVTGTVQGPTKRFASGEEELALLPDRWQRMLGPVHLFHNQPEVAALVYLSNRLGATLPNARWGDQVAVGESGLVGVLDYNFGKYQLLPLPNQSLAAIAREAKPLALPVARSDEYGLCSFNVHGFGRGEEQFPNAADYDAALRQRAGVIASDLVGCTVIALQETGTQDDAQAIASVLETDYALAYDAIAVEGAASRDAEFPLTNSLLVDRARVTVELVDAVEGCTAQDHGLVAPGLCPAGQYPLFDRPPLMAQLTIAGPWQSSGADASTVWVINNHWKSKSGDENDNARLRLAQATVVAERVQAILRTDPAAQIVVMGDLNDFYGDPAVATLQYMTGLFHPYAWLPSLDRYTYIFNGAAQVLDHVLVTSNLMPQLALVQILHLHADAATGDTPLVHSDHDPVVVRVRPSGAATIKGRLSWGEIAIVAEDGNGASLVQAVTDAHGEYRLWGLPVGPVTLRFDAPSWIILDEVEQMIDAPAGLLMSTGPQSRHIVTITGAWLALSTPWLADSVVPESLAGAAIP